MYTLINNEGKKVSIDKLAFNDLRTAYKHGIWCVYVKDIKGRTHCILLDDNRDKLS